MELFTMLAKLTLDASEFESKLNAAEQEARGFDIEDPHLGLDDHEFQQGIADANDAEVDDLDDPNLGIDDEEFTTGVDEANEAEVDDLDDPTLGIEDDEFTSGVEEANEAEVEDLDDPKLGLDSTEFTSGLQEAETEGESFGSIIGQVFENIKGALVTTGIVALVGQFVGFLKQGVALAGQNGDAIDKQSQKLHLSAQAYQEWNYVLGLSGASVADLTRAMRNFDEIQGGKITDDQAAYFEQLGISATDASGKMKSAQTLMEETLYALADYNGNDRGLITEAFFGKNSAGLNALLNSTSDEIKEMRQEANDLGLIMSDEDVKNAAAYMDATSRLEQSVQALQTALGETLLPILTDAANTLATIIAFFNPRTHQDNSLAKQFADTDAELAENLLDIEATSAAAEKMIDKLFSMGDAEKLTAKEQAEWKATAEWLVENIPSLSGVIDLDTQSITANKDEVINLTREWKNYAIERAKADALKEKQEALAKKTTEWLQAEAEAVKLEAEYTKLDEKVKQLLVRDWGNMDESGKSRFMSRFGYANESEIDWSEGSKVYGQLENALGQWYTEWGLSSYGSKELWDAIGDRSLKMDSIGSQLSDAREKADSLKTEVEEGQTELAEYSAVLDEVVGNLTSTGTEAETAEGNVKGLNDEVGKIPAHKTTTIDAIVNWKYNNGPTLLQKAIGDRYIPYDMPVMAHRGETILNATETRRMDSSSMDYGALRQEVVGAIREGMSGASVNSYLNGQDITDNVDRNMIRKLKARRFAG